MAHYTQKAIIQTFTEMLRKMPFDKITVSAIVSTCEISSNTFYYHFRDIYDLLDVWLKNVKRKYLIDPIAQKQSWQMTFKGILQAMKSNADITYHLFDSLSRERVEKYVFDAFDSTDNTLCQIVSQEFGNADIPEETFKYIAEYSGYAIVGFLLKYLWLHMEPDIDEMIEKIGYIFEGNIRWAIKFSEEKASERK